MYLYVSLFVCRGKERSRLRGDIVLPGKEYSGRKSSRAAIFGSEGEGEDDGSDEEEEGLRGSEEEASLHEADDSEEAESDEEMEEASEEEEEEEEQSESEGAAGANGISNGFGVGKEDQEEDEAAALEREYREMQQQEADTVAGLQERAAKERKKGLAVRAQRSLWEAGLEVRILLQKALQAGNKLPQPESHRVAVAIDPELASGLSGLARDAAGVVEDLLGLLSSIEEQHPAVGEAAAAAGVKRKRSDDKEDGADVAGSLSDRLWAQLDDSYQRFAPFRDASIDRWHRKTVLSSGTAARGGLKVLNQSVSNQVEMLMQESTRVVERTRLPKRLCRPLCSIEADKVRRLHV